MDAPKCRLCGDRHYGLCPGIVRSKATAPKREVRGPVSRSSAVHGGKSGSGHPAKLVKADPVLSKQPSSPRAVQDLAAPKPKRGRPRIGDPPRSKPWVALGMSRTTWWRRQAERAKKTGVPPK